MPWNADITLAALQRLMRDAGVCRLYLKRLAPNDNSKNQVYLGSGFEAVNIIPNRGIIDDRADATAILKAAVAFRWIDPSGAQHEAPNAQLILYPQYPEVRMSGFLKGCRTAPSGVMASRDPGRVLLLGVTTRGEVIGWAARHDHPVVAEIDALGELRRVGVFEEIPLIAQDSRRLLLTELARIHLLGWIDAKRLRSDGTEGPCNSSNCGGYTLEAELGIIPNGFSDPDFLGWEVKQHGVAAFDRPSSGSPITLMTPEPTGGIYRDEGPSAFIRRFGYADTMGRPDRLNFGGVFRAGECSPKTGVKLVLDGFNAESGQIEDVTKGITLVSANGEIAAVWHYAGLIAHWQRKHDRAAYVPSQHRASPHKQYRYGHEILLGEGTDFLKFLKAMARGAVYYDPGIKLEGASGSGTLKRRSQFRIKWKDIPALYTRSELVSVLA
jgi:hypothetical protein